MPRTNNATRAAALALVYDAGYPYKDAGYVLGLSELQVRRICARAIERGFDEKAKPLVIRDAFVQDAPRSDRSNQQGPKVQQLISNKVSSDRFRQERSCTDLAASTRTAGYQI